MSKPANLLTLMLALFSALALTACGGGSSGGGQEDGTGTLSVGITDAGAEEVKEVWVKFTGVTVKPKSGAQQYYPVESEENSLGLPVNLMALTGERHVQLLDNQVLPTGEYNWIALEIATNDEVEPNNLYVETDLGLIEEMEVEIPSGQQSGLRLVSGFTVLTRFYLEGNTSPLRSYCLSSI